MVIGAILYTSQPSHSHWPGPSSQPLSSGSDTLALSLIDSLRWSFPRKHYGMSYGQVSRPEQGLINPWHSFIWMYVFITAPRQAVKLHSVCQWWINTPPPPCWKHNTSSISLLPKQIYLQPLHFNIFCYLLPAVRLFYDCDQSKNRLFNWN